MLALALAGSLAFALSGALAGVRAGLDLFGVVVVGAATGLAGGILRDVLLEVPPTALADWRFAAIVAVGAAIAILANPALERSRKGMDLAEAVGLSFACVAGTMSASQHHCGAGEAVILGALTGIGGGVVRDLLVGEPPVVLRRGFYAVPALAGAAAYMAAAEVGEGSTLAAALAVSVCLGLRLPAIAMDIHLPGAPVDGLLGRRTRR